MRGRHVWFAVTLLGLMTVMAGCASDKPLRINERLTSLRMVAKRPPDAIYIVDPPDTIQIEFTNLAEAPRTVRVRQDGTVTLPLLHDVEVAGLTTDQIRDRLQDAYAGYYRDPQILVTVANYASKQVYLYGEVRGQGARPYTGYQTLSSAIGAAGGVTRRAATGRVKVIRGDPDHPQVFKVDLDDLLFEGEALQDVSLAEGDVVYVPPTVLAWIGYQVEAVLFPFRSVISVFATYDTIQDIGDNDN